jgi:glycosyltransferase involved in cell wall biosynthesis
VRTVLFATQTLAPVGGIQRWLDQLAEALPARGWRVVLGLAWGARFHDPFAFRAAHPGVDSVLLDGRSGTRAGRLLALHAAFDRVRPQVVVPVTLHDPFTAVAERRARGHDLRLLFGSYEVSAPLLLDARRYGGLIDQALGVSRLTAALLVDVAGLPAARVAYVPSGVPAPSRPWVARDPQAPLRLGYVGRFDPDKRPLDLVTLAVELRRRGLDCELTAVGAGSLGQELRASARGAGVLGAALRVRDSLPREQLYAEVYPALDALLLFSPAEGLPSVLLEGMRHGVVPVTSDFAGRAAQGLVRHDETGLVFPVGDARAAAEQVVRLQREPGLHARLGAAARAAAEHGYSLESMAEGWAAALERACAGAPAPGAPPDQPRHRSRLERLTGRRAAETLRRLLGRRFAHPDAGEWPHCGEWSPDELRAVAACIDAAGRAGA